MRILQITAHATRGLSAAPAFILHTATTHALSLAASLVPTDRDYLTCLRSRSRLYEEMIRAFAADASTRSAGSKAAANANADGPAGAVVYGATDTTVGASLLSALEMYLAGGFQAGEEEDGRSVVSRGATGRSRRGAAAR